MINKRLSQNINNEDSLDRLKEFIKLKMEYTEERQFSCTIKDLKIPLKDFGLDELVKGKHWVSGLRAMFELCDIKVAEHTDWSFNGVIDRRKNKILHMKLK